MNWQETAARLQSHRDKTVKEYLCPSIPDDLPQNVTGLPRLLLNEEVLRITDLSPEKLVALLTTGQLTSTEATKAFLQRAALAAKLTNCVTELISERALQRAKYLDAYYAEHKKPIGPLHGLPLSVKEGLSLKGMLSTAGLLSFTDTIRQDDALVVKLLEAAGGVFFTRTTGPQALLQVETHSNIWDITTNPYNRNLSSGGSTGGEGPLIALHGSPLGIGGDLGGSVRNPAASNGIFGLKPTAGRIPLTGSWAPMMGNEQLVPAGGPLSSSLAGIHMYMSAIIDQKPWVHDRSLVPLPWRRITDTSTNSFLRIGPDGRRKLRVGILADDGVVTPHPPIRRGLQELVSRLQGQPDIEVVDFPPYNHAYAWDLFIKLLLPDGGAETKAEIARSGEPVLPLTQTILDRAQEHSLAGVWELTKQRGVYRAGYTRHWDGVRGSSTAATAATDASSSTPPPVLTYTDEDKVDVILTPAGPSTATLHGTARYWGYTSQWNLLDYPAIAFPTGLYCNLQDDKADVDLDYKPRNEDDEYNYKLYTPEAYLDAPISLQLVGRRYEEEKLLEALEFILSAAGMKTVAA